VKLGWTPDVMDPRDLPASEILLSSSPVPAKSDNMALVPAVLDQGGLSSCVANACATALRASDIKRGNHLAELPSRLYLYKGARNSHGAGRKDEGTYIRACLEFARRRGYPLESAWPYVESRVNRQPSMDAIMQAFDSRSPTRYLRIWDAGAARVDAVKRALGKGHLVVFGVDIDAAFLRLGPDHEPLKPFDRTALIGGHAMSVVDHDGDVFRCVNSWGTDWGQGGFFRASADLIAWVWARDFWIVDEGAGK
jgi:C1A family cysteine protease